MVKTQWLTLPLLIALVILPRLSVDLYLPSLPSMVGSLNATDASLQMTMTMFMFGYALSMLIAGPLSDSIGRKRVMFYGLITYMIATLACAFAPSVGFLIVGRFFQALGGCCGTVVARVMVKDAYSKEEQIKVLAHLSSAMAICPLITPVLGGTLQMMFGWRAVFFLLAFFSLLLFILGEREIQEFSHQHVALSLKKLLLNFKMLLTHRLFIGYSLAIGLAWCNYFAFTLESPFLMQDILGLSPVAFGAVFSLVVVGYLAGTRFTRVLANKVGWDNLIFAAALLSISGALLMAVLVFFMKLNWAIIAFPMMLTMCGVGIIIPCTQAAVMQPFPAIAGTASGLFFFIQMLFGGLCGLIIQSFRNDAAATLAIVVLIASVMLLVSFYKIIWIHSKG